MTRYSKFNIVYHLQKWMDSVPGQTFLNYAYSWGAAIVIFGTLCKLTHIPGANFWLFLGMGTEVVVFFLSAFDRPFDKTAEGRELPMHLGVAEEDNEEMVASQSAVVRPVTKQAADYSAVILSQQSAAEAQVAAVQSAVAPSMAAPSSNPEMAEAQKNYVEELQKLTVVLSKVGEQSSRLTRDSEEMENLNRTLTGICKVYEMQLKSASQQIGTIDQINEQSKMMAQHIEQLNKIYTRMIEAMTINMRSAAPGMTGTGQQNGF